MARTALEASVTESATDATVSLAALAAPPTGSAVITARAARSSAVAVTDPAADSTAWVAWETASAVRPAAFWAIGRAASLIRSITGSAASTRGPGLRKVSMPPAMKVEARRGRAMLRTIMSVFYPPWNGDRPDRQVRLDHRWVVRRPASVPSPEPTVARAETIDRAVKCGGNLRG